MANTDAAAGDDPSPRQWTHVGARRPRAAARRHVAGHGNFVDDIDLPRMAHAAFLRSPHAHARIRAIDVRQAKAMSGVVVVLTGNDLARHVTPWRGVLTHIAGLRSAAQHPLAIDRVCWQGEPVAVAVADSRAAAEDAVERIGIEWEPLAAVVDPTTALDPGTPVIHDEFGDNLAFERWFEAGDTKAGFAGARTTVEAAFRFDRQAGVTPEPRTILADFAAPDGPLTVYHSGQTPHVMQALLAKHLGIPEHRVRVVSPDVGGSYGIKIHFYGDEVATAALARILARPVKFVADRLESFVTDIHSRSHLVRARIGLDELGRIVGLELEDTMDIGAYSAYPRASVHELNMLINLSGAAYTIENYQAGGRVVFQNKNLTSQFRGVGHPMLTTVCESMIDRAAAAGGFDPAELRRRNLIPDDDYPRVTLTGRRLEGNSHHACLDRLLEVMDYRRLRERQEERRAKGRLPGIGLATFVESTGPGATSYGAGDVPISAQDSTCMTLQPSGIVTCASGVTEQGQGTEEMLAQVTADAVGVDVADVHVVTGDTDKVPYGGGTWGSRGTPVGGEATWRAGRALRANILAVAGGLLQSPPDELDIANGAVVDRKGDRRLTLAEIARIAYYRSADLPRNVFPEFSVTRSFRPDGDTHAFTNGIHGSHVEVDPETGFVRLLGHWVVEDCGRMVNPLLVDEQVRGGAALGIGWALFEQCLYDESGQLLNGSMFDYLVPMPTEIPDIVVEHLETPTPNSELGAKGAGESGVVAAPAAVLNAVNDALAPLNASVEAIPITPQRIRAALDRSGSA